MAYRRLRGESPAPGEYHERFPALDAAWLEHALATSGPAFDQAPVPSHLRPLPPVSSGERPTPYIYTLSLHDALPICFYPLGSCTMKYNPRINERLAALPGFAGRSEEHTSELQSLRHLVCRLLLEKKNGVPASARGVAGAGRVSRALPGPRRRLARACSGHVRSRL